MKCTTVHKLRMPPPASPKIPGIPSNTPNSPSYPPRSSSLCLEPCAHLTENFLASQPAETFLQELYGLRPSQNPPNRGQLKMNFVDRLKRLDITRALKAPNSQGRGKS